MSTHEWGSLLPGGVANWINFDRNNPDWHYDEAHATSMPAKQAEGVAYLWNLLSRLGVALLADEVGMGKTFQALGVAALLWKMKPDAKVLIMAPNKDICAHWRREYDEFVRSHYRAHDHCVKSRVDGAPVQSIQICPKLEGLVAAVEAGAGQLFLTTIHALSGLVPSAEKGKDNAGLAAQYAKAFHDRIKRALGGAGFDLIIVDEAHYLRNREGGSQRVSAALEFFGRPGARLARRALLLTATPSHTRLQDVHHILNYFMTSGDGDDVSAHALMKKYGLRRFRRMQGKGQDFSKRAYRCEKDVPCDFGQRPESELFFALYQKKLVTELGMTRENKSLLYGFLEGFESVGRVVAPDAEAPDAAEMEEEFSGKDFSKARDTDLLARLTGQFSSAFGHLPDHPKYGQLVTQCLPVDLFAAHRDLHEDKHLVFVRRIPSVRELTQRLNEAYDNLLAKRICLAWGLSEDDPAVEKWRKSTPAWSRAGFDELVRSCQSGSVESEEELEDDEASHPDSEGDAYLGSSIADLFVVKKGKNGRTDATNVSLRFRKPESAFAMFLEPARDYMQEGYRDYYQYLQGGKVRANYVSAARDARFARHPVFARYAEVTSRAYEARTYDAEIKTVWSLVYPELSAAHQHILSGWAKTRPDVAENFANYIKAGFLFASPVMVELYGWFTEFNRLSGSSTKDVQNRYADFMAFVADQGRIKHSLLLAYFRSALDSFEMLCEKIIDHKPGEWEKEWRVLTSLQNPAWYASGQSDNRQRLILGFNSPFYPNVLVATSVFQEGVNLHLQCRKVHHYGLAGSPGDNEQRVGRVDRLFGKVNAMLRETGQAELAIHYPFLTNSVDEDQVASFIARKFHVEEKMDACVQEAFDRSVELTRENWREYLRTPKNAQSLQGDPYPATFETHQTYRPSEGYDQPDIAKHVQALLAQILSSTAYKKYSVAENEHNPNAILVIDSMVDRCGQLRRQPVLVEQHSSAEFSVLVSAPVYYLSLISPIATRADLAGINGVYDEILPELGVKLAQEYPLARMALNPDAANSHFYLYVRVDLPVFPDNGRLAFLSRSEMEFAFHQVLHYADRLEFELFNGERDLTLSQLQVTHFLHDEQHDVLTMEGKWHPATAGSANWVLIESDNGNVERLNTTVKHSALAKHFSDIEPMALSLARLLELNHRLPFISCWLNDPESLKLSISYPAGDVQKVERALLERWFAYVQ
ncbi:DEAD/DEAH box helicase [Chitinilyticum aquatile]|uniref:DEAD/DEAH box helicase n=1 Tax=Chitinilyticum aquatile TaxID=362520 RepID=UPI0003F67166|nr:DEAD/DEAH box helicase [Chitinilyticum aquatile]